MSASPHSHYRMIWRNRKSFGPALFWWVSPAPSPRQRCLTFDIGRTLSLLKPDIFDNDEVEIEISSATPTLRPSSPVRRRATTRRGVLCVGQAAFLPESRLIRHAEYIRHDEENSRRKTTTVTLHDILYMTNTVVHNLF